MRLFGYILIAAALFGVSPALFAVPGMVVYQIGDIDDFTYNGSSDWPDVDPDWLTSIQDWQTVPFPRSGFDDAIHQNVHCPFTFAYELASGEEVIGATLEVVVKAVNADSSTDAISLELTENLFTFQELGWLPISSSGAQTRTLDLSNVMGTDFLPQLQDGQLNVLILDDTGIDYATLTVEVIPEPATLLLLGLGGLGLIRVRERKQ
ncbi:MAG: PEP-CTERM sorting domain-containing protein [Planctomycetota bacterium]|jgi:hypothetical protein